MTTTLATDPDSSDFADWPVELVDCYQQHVAALTSYLLTLVGDLPLAQDMAQEAFVRLFAKWRGVRFPRAYVYETGVNLARMHWRSSGRERGAFASIFRTTTAEQPEHDPWLRDLVERLPKRLRLPVLLHYYADLPLEEVSAHLRLPLGTTKRRLYEGRCLLRAMLETSNA